MSEKIVFALTSLGEIANTAIGGFNESRAITMQSNMEADQFQRNADYADFKAGDAKIRGDKEALETKKKTKTLIGRQRAAMAAQGIDIGSGSALDIQMETAELGAMDALTIKNNAFREAMGYRIESVDQQSQGEFTKLVGKSKARSGLITTGLKSAGQFTSSIKKWQDVHRE